MKYSKEFKALINSTHEEYIGHGNPNANILFIGQEGASDPYAPIGADGRNDYMRSLKGNREDWSRNIQEEIWYGNLGESCTPDTLKNFNPLYPYKGQKFQVRTGSEESGNLKGTKGTARTWYNYQKLINRIFELFSAERKPMTKEDDIDFHRYSFHSDMSAVALKKHSAKNEAGKKSVVERKSLLSSVFFHNFPIVIAAVGHFPHDTYGDNYFVTLFDVKYIGNQAGDNLPWINVSVREGDNPQLLIHCRQASAPLPNAYFERIAEIVCEFADKYNINLNPSE